MKLGASGLRHRRVRSGRRASPSAPTESLGPDPAAQRKQNAACKQQRATSKWQVARGKRPEASGEFYRAVRERNLTANKHGGVGRNLEGCYRTFVRGIGGHAR